MDIQASPEPSPSTYSASGRRGGHLKRLSLSVAPRDLAGESSSSNSLFSPERSSTSISPSTKLNSARPDATISPLNRSLGSSRRQRPLSLYSNSSSNGSHGALDGLAASPSPVIKNLPICEETEHEGTAQEATFTPSSSTTASRASPGLPLTPLSAGRSELNSSVGRRSILGRSAHARRQSSISYARSPSAVSPINGSGPSTPRSSTSTPRETPGHPGFPASSASSGVEASDNSAQTPARLDYFGAARPATTKTPIHIPEERESESPKTSPYNELNVGIGAKSADLLTFIAKKERKCMDLREELKRNEEELASLKKKWEAIIQREMMSAAAAAADSSSTSPARSESSSPQQSTQAPSSAGGLFSSITASLSASTSASTSSASTASPSPSSRPSPASASSRRLLTSRHSISISPTASRSPKLGADSYFGGANLSLQESPTDRIAATSPGASAQASYEVSKVAKSWLGGVMKHASSVLETLAPPPVASSNDLGTVREEEEPEESDEETSDSRHKHDAEDSRRISTATADTTSSTASSNSPSSSYDEHEEDGRFSSTATSRSSSISSMDSHNDALHLSKSEESVGTLTDSSKHHKQGDDITPVSTPLLPDTTPRAGKSPNTEVDDLWGLDGFEDTTARENREKLEQARIDEVHTSPPKNRTPVEVTKPNHGRRRSTAFELGGAWGSMMGKKWSEVANSETFKTSKRATMNFVDTFEKTLGDALFEAPSAKKASPDSSKGSMVYLDGEYVPSSIVESPSPSERERSLPSGIGSAGAWSTLLGRAKTTPKNKNEEWTAQSLNGDLGETSMSPSSASSARSPGGSRKARIALNDNPLEEDESFESFNDNLFPSTSPSQNTNSRASSIKSIQPTISASRTKHSKRMSLPNNLLVGEPRRPSFGLGLENVSEEDKAETDDAWGW